MPSNCINYYYPSIGANVEEADAGQTRKDFIAKMSIASKEARECNYWLRLMNASNIIDFNFEELIQRSEELIKILTSIVKTSQLNIKHYFENRHPIRSSRPTQKSL